MRGGTSKVVMSRSTRSDFDVDYLFGQVSIDKPVIDWSGVMMSRSARRLMEGWVRVPAPDDARSS
jgi:2-methylaconitate cis-trans-isomerase PrpF